MKRTVRTTILTLAIVSLMMVCMTTFTYAGGFGAGPDLPTKIDAVNTSDGVNLTWEISVQADGYKVYRCSPEQKHPIKIAEVVGADTTSYTDETAESGKKYEYYIRAYKGLFMSPLSDKCEAVRLSEPIIKSVLSAESSIEVKWKKSPGAQGYYIYRKTDSGIKLLSDVKGDGKCSFNDKAVAEGEVYTYTVTAYRGEFRSSHGYKKSLPYVASPEINSIKNNGSSVRIKWNNSSSADSVVVYRKTNQQAKWEKIKVLSPSKSTFTDNDVKSGNAYTYTLRAISNNIYSGYNKKGVTTQFLSAPAKLSAENYNDGVTLVWDSVAGAESYNVYRKREGKTKLIGQTAEPRFSDTDTKDGKEYTYTVKAVGSEEKYLSSDSNRAECFVLKKPLNIAVVNLFDGIQIYWQKSEFATGYIVYRKLYGEAEWTKIKAVKSEKTNYIIDRDVEKDNTYIYSVKCLRKTTEGSFDVNGVTIRHIPSLGIEATLCPEGIKLLWNEVQNCSGYELYRKTGESDEWTKIASFPSTKSACIDGSPVYSEKNSYFVRVLFEDGGAIDSPLTSAYGIDPKKPMVALTYDDGPSNSVTNRILDNLQKYNGRATFFVVGERVSEFRESLKRAVRLDCEIGNHSYHHKDLVTSTAKEIRDEINSTNTAVEKITGITPVIARAPGGAVDDLARENVGMPFIYWSIDTLDWKYRNEDSVIEAVKSQVTDGSIILMHDLYDSTAGASDVLIPWLTQNGYQLVTVSEMMAVKGIELKAGETYISG